MPRLTKKELNEFLLKPNLVKVATISRDGWPSVNPAWYLWQDGGLWLNGRKGFGGITSSWVENIERDQRVGALIDTDDQPYTRVLMKGTAKVVDPPPKNWPDLNLAMTVHYIGKSSADHYIGSLPEVPGAWFWIKPDQIFSWRGSEWHPRYLKGS